MAIWHLQGVHWLHEHALFITARNGFSVCILPTKTIFVVVQSRIRSAVGVSVTAVVMSASVSRGV